MRLAAQKLKPTAGPDSFKIVPKKSDIPGIDVPDNLTGSRRICGAIVCFRTPIGVMQRRFAANAGAYRLEVTRDSLKVSEIVNEETPPPVADKIALRNEVHELHNLSGSKSIFHKLRERLKVAEVLPRPSGVVLVPAASLEVRVRRENTVPRISHECELEVLTKSLATKNRDVVRSSIVVWQLAKDAESNGCSSGLRCMNKYRTQFVTTTKRERPFGRRINGATERSKFLWV